MNRQRPAHRLEVVAGVEHRARQNVSRAVAAVYPQVGVVLRVGALTFVPALALGPVVEHLQMIGSR